MLLSQQSNAEKSQISVQKADRSKGKFKIKLVNTSGVSHPPPLGASGISAGGKSKKKKKKKKRKVVTLKEGAHSS